MVYSIQNAAFLSDKHQFFSNLPANGTVDLKIKSVDTRAGSQGYLFLLSNYKALETEFTDIFEVLQKNDNQNKEIFWLYCYYCASLLERFYQAYSQQGKVDHYKKIKEDIKDRLNHKVQAKESEEFFIDHLKKSFLKDINNLKAIPYHVSQIRDNVAYINLCRLYWAFCRMTLTTALTIAKDTHLIDQLDAILGTHTDVDKIISVFKAPIPVINYLSVGFFAFRIMIDGGLLLKHTFFPSDIEKGNNAGAELHKLDYLPGAAAIEAYRNQYIMIKADSSADFMLYYVPKQGEPLKINSNHTDKLRDGLNSCFGGNQSSQRLDAFKIKDTITLYTGHSPEAVTAYDRFKFELYKRQGNFGNDFVWATVNFLTNLNHLSHIPGPITGYITAGFLLFDVAMLLYRSHLAEQEYLSKLAQYIQERNDLNNPGKCAGMLDATRLLRIEMIDKQMQELEVNWRTKQSTFYFNAGGAALLMMGFSAAIILSNPVLILAGFFVSLVGVAIYLSSDSYTKYKNKSLCLQNAQLSGINVPSAMKELEAARNDFIFTMVKNTAMPMVMITTFAICWPAAVVLTAMYAGYELYHAYDQHADNKAAKQLLFKPEVKEQAPKAIASMDNPAC